MIFHRLIHVLGRTNINGQSRLRVFRSSYRNRNNLPDPATHYSSYRGRFVHSWIDAYWGPCRKYGLYMSEEIELRKKRLIQRQQSPK